MSLDICRLQLPFGHVHRRAINAWVRKSDLIEFKGTKKKIEEEKNNNSTKNCTTLPKTWEICDGTFDEGHLSSCFTFVPEHKTISNSCLCPNSELDVVIATAIT